jgi:hypothetical protein
VARHISFCVPQPGSTGSLRDEVSKSQVTWMARLQDELGRGVNGCAIEHRGHWLLDGPGGALQRAAFHPAADAGDFVIGGQGKQGIRRGAATRSLQ